MTFYGKGLASRVGTILPQASPDAGRIDRRNIRPTLARQPGRHRGPNGHAAAGAGLVNH